MGVISIEGIMPQDVVENSGDIIPLIGELTGEPNEIVVLMQIGRIVQSAFVCHVTDITHKKNKGNNLRCITDIPNFPKLMIISDSEIHEYNNIKYTMACLADKDFELSHANWLS